MLLVQLNTSLKSMAQGWKQSLTDSSVCPVQENKQQQTSKKHDLQVSSAVFFPYTVFQWELSL